MQHLPAVPVFYEAHLCSHQRGHAIDLNMQPHAIWVIRAARNFHHFVFLIHTSHTIYSICMWFLDEHNLDNYNF